MCTNVSTNCMFVTNGIDNYDAKLRKNIYGLKNQVYDIVHYTCGLTGQEHFIVSIGDFTSLIYELYTYIYIYVYIYIFHAFIIIICLTYLYI